MTKDHDTIIVGAGISGLLSALALSKEGKKVLLLEKNDKIGGVCTSYSVDGYLVDTGPHVITRLEQGPLRELMNRYFDVIPNFVPHGKYYVRLNNKVRPFPWNIQGWLSFDLLPQMDRLYLIKTLFSISYVYNSGEDLSKKSVGELFGNGLSEQTTRFLNCLSYFMTGASMDETPVERFLDSEHYKSMSNNIVEKLHNILMREGALDQSCLKGGLRSLITAICSSMPEGMVEIRTGEEVVRIDPDLKRLETNKGEYNYKTLIYSGFATDLPKLIGNVPKEFSESLMNLPTTRTLTIWMGLNRKVFNRQGSEIWVDSDPYTWVVPISNYDPNLAPKDKQLAAFAFRMTEGRDMETEKKRALNAVYSVIPEIEDSIDMIHYQSHTPDKTAWTTSTVFADIKTPFEGIYLVGTDTVKRSMGVTRASYSVLELLETLKTDKVI